MTGSRRPGRTPVSRTDLLQSRRLPDAPRPRHRLPSRRPARAAARLSAGHAMALSAGRTVGPYEILGPLGVGGMGEVYRARDTRLARDVAIKALPETFAHDPDRIARLQREAQVLAALNHPNIAQLYGLEEAGGRRYLVLEL